MREPEPSLTSAAITTGGFALIDSETEDCNGGAPENEGDSMIRDWKGGFAADDAGENPGERITPELMGTEPVAEGGALWETLSTMAPLTDCRGRSITRGLIGSARPCGGVWSGEVGADIFGEDRSVIAIGVLGSEGDGE